MSLICGVCMLCDHTVLANAKPVKVEAAVVQTIPSNMTLRYLNTHVMDGSLWGVAGEEDPTSSDSYHKQVLKTFTGPTLAMSSKRADQHLSCWLCRQNFWWSR